jgi:hypothetical protein
MLVRQRETKQEQRLPLKSIDNPDKRRSASKSTGRVAQKPKVAKDKEFRMFKQSAIET